MSYFIKLRNWFTSQEHLLFLFALLFIVPNCVLFFTEPLPVTVGIASLILPYAFWVGLLLLARKPRYRCLVPVTESYIGRGAACAALSFGESVIAVDMFLNLTSSTASEASELLGNIFLVIIGVFFFYTLPTLLLAVWSVRMKKKLTNSFRKKMGGKKSGCVYTGDHSFACWLRYKAIWFR